MRKFLHLFRIVVILMVTAVTGVAQTVFINEIHYDNAGTDIGESVEIAGPAGTDLTGWSLILYNGSGGATYVTTSLSGTITNMYNGYGFVTVTYSSNGIQNGSPDGLALVDASSNVIQFLSYEGTFIAAGGAANGMTSTDIGVAELGTGAVGNSLQLAGTGSIYTDFAWQAEAANTFGAVNTGQDFSGGSLSLVINEFVVNHTGTDINEFVEVKSSPGTDLSDYTLLEIEGDGTTAGIIDEIISLGTTDGNGYWATGMVNNAFENGSLTLLLVKNFTGALNDDLDTDNDGVLDILPWDEIADDVAINDGGLTDSNYSSVILSQNFDGGSFTVGGASRIPDGTDTNSATDWVRNDFDGQGLPDFPAALAENGEALNTPGAANEVAVVVEQISLIINEVDSDTPGTDAEEFIELFDGGFGNKALDGYVVVFYNGNNDLSYAAYDLDGYSSNSEGYFVLGNPGIPNVDLTFAGNFLQNGADAIALFKDDAVNFPNGTAVTTNNLVDALVYDTNDADDMGLLVLLNAGEQQINEAEVNGAEYSMQRIPNGSGGERNTGAYTTATPTPGTENGAVIPAPELITIAEARVLADGTLTTVSGILTVSDQFAGSAYLQDETAGIAVFDVQVHGAGLFQIGDSITITGTKSTYNGQIQISPVSEVTSSGTAVFPVQPVTITLAELSSHPSQLVKIADVSFPNPGALIFGNTNIIVADGSGSGEMRIDADASDLVGLAQPGTCEEVVGVVGRYNDLFQFMPRIKSDLPCAEKYKHTGEDLAISKDLTLDIATWNMEWFGDEANSPAGALADVVQKDSVKAVLNALDADIYAVEEISDDATFAQMVSEMNGYSYVLSDATSYPNDGGVKQKVGFIFKTSTVTAIKAMPLLATIHPYYNGGDGSALTSYPGGDATRFYASGRLPFLMIADVTINGITKTYHVIDIHARANDNADPLLKYEMRKYDVDVLKDTLDGYYADANVILLGDYNDDVDVTVANVTTSVTTYENFVNDSDNYSPVTGILSGEGFRSYVFETDMIDHITVTNELFEDYIDGSARVHYEFYDSDYTKTASDHFPVSARFQIMNLEVLSITSTGIDCFEGSNGSATVEVIGGIPPYSYAWSDGQTTATAENLSAGIYTVIVTDELNNEVSAEIELTDPDPIEIVLSDNQVVYPAYSDSACATISVIDIYGGSGSYTYLWSTGETTEMINVCPIEETLYMFTVTDENGCTATSSVTVTPIDITCGKNLRKLQVCFHGNPLCIAYNAVDKLLRNGAILGACAEESKEPVVLDRFSVYPNPFVSNITVIFNSDEKTDAILEIKTDLGTSVFSEAVTIHKGFNKIDLNLFSLISGTYIVFVYGNDVIPISEKIIKQ